MDDNLICKIAAGTFLMSGVAAGLFSIAVWALYQ